MAAETTTRVIQYDIKGSREAIAAIKAQSEAFERLEKKIDGSIGTVKKFFAALTTYVSLSTVKDIFSSLINGMDDLADKSQKLGISAEGLQAWAYAAEMSGTNAETLEGGIKKLSTGLGSINDATADSTKALKKFGIDAKTSTEDALLKIAEGFSKMQDGSQKTAEAMKIFGKSAGPELIPLLNMGKDGIEEFLNKAREMGLVINNETILAVNNMKDKIDDMSKSIKAAGLQLVSGMVPALSALTDEFLSANTQAGEFKTTGEAIGDMLINVSSWLIQATANARGWVTIFATANDVLSPMFKGDRTQLIKDAIQAVEEYDKKAKETIDSLNRKYDQAKNLRGNQSWAKSLNLLPPEPKLRGGGGGEVKTAGKSPTEKAIETVDAYTDSITKANIQLKNLSQVQQLEYLILEKGIDVTDKRIAGHYAEAKARAEMADLRDRNVRAEEAEVEAGLKHIKVMTDEQKEFEKLREKYIDMGDPHEDYIRSLEEINKLSADPRVTDEQRKQLLSAIDKLEKGYLAKLRKNADGTKSEIQEMGELLQREIEGFAKNSADAIAEFCFGAKLSFSEMIQSMLMDLAKLALKRAIDPFFKAVGDASGDFIGSIFKPSAQGNAFGPSGIVPFAQGGVLGGATFFGMPGGKMGVAGEAGAEAVAPLMRSKSGKLGVSSAPFTVNVINNNGSKIKVEESESTQGGKQLQIMVDNAVEQSLGRGRFDRILSTSYGVTRRGK